MELRDLPFVLVILLVGARSSIANDTVVVAFDRFAVDSTLSLILVAGGVDHINTQAADNKGTILLDQYYQFAFPQADLQVGVAYPVQNESGTAHTLYFTDLPVIWITTPHEIVDEPKVPGSFRMFTVGENLASTHIGIEIRGGVSQDYPKKSYRLAFRSDSSGTASMDVPLLGMRSDDDWNLLALYNEPLRLRSKIGQDLWMAIHPPHYALQEPTAMSGARMEHVEVLLNGRYQGVYALCEPVDRKQLQLRSYNGNLRGRLYKSADWGPAVDMVAHPPYSNDSLTWGGFEYKYPEEVVDWSQLHAFVGEVVHMEQDPFLDLFPFRFHMGNAVDYFLFLNLLRAVDNRSKNTYIAQYNSTTPYFYVPWDLNGTFGRDWEGTVDSSTTSVLFNAMYQRVRWDCSEDGFMGLARQRWADLRQGAFDVATLMERFHLSYERLLSAGVYEREEIAWNDHDHDPNELDGLQQWLEQRTTYLDDWFQNACAHTSSSGRVAGLDVHMYPNPARERVLLEGEVLRSDVIIEVLDALGRVVRRMDAEQGRTSVELAGIVPGVYRVRLVHEGNVLFGKTLVVE